MQKDHKALLDSSQKLSSELKKIKIQDYADTNNSDIVVYNVLDYAWDAWKEYILKYANNSASSLILGINPGPHGMVQTGIPFGNISTVKHWLNINATINQPQTLHPKRPVLGMDYKKEEPSGLLLWNTMKEQYKTSQRFFRDFFVINYCPLAFFDEDGKNLTPDRLPLEYRKKIELCCSEHLGAYIKTLSLNHIIAVGRYSHKKAENIVHVLQERYPSQDIYKNIETYYLTHPSPLNPKHKNFPSEFLELSRSLSK